MAETTQEPEEMAFYLTLDQMLQYARENELIGCVNLEPFRGLPAGTIQVTEINRVPVGRSLDSNPDSVYWSTEIIWTYNPDGFPLELPRIRFADHPILKPLGWPED